MSTIRLAIIAALDLLALGTAGTVVHQISSSGYNSRIVEEARDANVRTDNANRADDAARRCSADPDCRLRDDGYRRD